MKIYVVNGINHLLGSLHTSGTYTSRELAEAHVKRDDLTWFDDETTISEVEVLNRLPEERIKQGLPGERVNQEHAE